MGSVDYEVLGRRIRRHRLALHYTQHQAAKVVGCSFSFYRNIERGGRILSVETLVSIARAFNLSLDALLKDWIRQTSEEVTSDRVVLDRIHEILDDFFVRHGIDAEG